VKVERQAAEVSAAERYFFEPWATEYRSPARIPSRMITADAKPLYS
jgi:hypothetical protein